MDNIYGSAQSISDNEVLSSMSPQMYEIFRGKKKRKKGKQELKLKKKSRKFIEKCLKKFVKKEFKRYAELFTPPIQAEKKWGEFIVSNLIQATPKALDVYLSSKKH